MEALGIKRGLPVPQGQQVRVTSAAAVLGGEVSDPLEMGTMIHIGTDAQFHVPYGRFDVELYFADDPATFEPGRNSYAVHGALLQDEDLFSFDNDFFGISAEDAMTLWPRCRQLLQVGYECLYREGFRKATLRNKNIGVYLGDCGTGAWPDIIWSRVATGDWTMKPYLEHMSIAMGGPRLSYTFGLKGPSVQMDTACSSGLTAVNVAHHDLLKEDTAHGQRKVGVSSKCEGAIGAGVNQSTSIDVYIGNSAANMLSRAGRCFTYDGSADGYARGDGTVCLFLKCSSEEAVIRDQLACLVGVQCNQDGRSASMYAPNGPAQQACVRDALVEARVSPSEVSVFEGHGTGTSLGDPIEVHSTKAVSITEPREAPLQLTTAKTNIGHLEASAGITGLLKNIVTMLRSEAAPNLHLRSLNGHLEVDEFVAVFATEGVATGLNAGVAGVNSFGMGGSNAHAVAWVQSRVGPHKANETFDTSVLDQIVVTCPITRGHIDHLSGEASTGRRSYKADVIREEFAPYDISSHVYTGAYRFRLDALYEASEAGDDEIDPDLRIFIRGSWSGWSTLQEMQLQDDGSFAFHVVLGETRCEMFQLCVDEDTSMMLYPAVNLASVPRHDRESIIAILGPDDQGHGRNWIIDGRDDEVAEGTVFLVRFKWGKTRKTIGWEEVSLEEKLDWHWHHSYSVCGSWSGWMLQDLVQLKGHSSSWYGSFEIGVTGEEDFQLVRDHDWQQTIYPADREASKTTVPVRGPDNLGHGKNWKVRGSPHEKVKLELQVTDGRVVLTLQSASNGTKVWESCEGWERHEYFVVGSWNDWHPAKMQMDVAQPGIFRYRSCCRPLPYTGEGSIEYFHIEVDGDHDRRLYPQFDAADSGVSIVCGPEGKCPDNNWCISSSADNAGFEIILDPHAKDWRRRVVWIAT